MFRCGLIPQPILQTIATETKLVAHTSHTTALLQPRSFTHRFNTLRWFGLRTSTVWTSNHTNYDVRDKIIYPFPNFNGRSRWSLEMNMWFHLTLDWACGYLSMPGFKLIRVSLRVPCWLTTVFKRDYSQTYISVWTHKRHIIFCHQRQPVGCILLEFCRKYTIL